MISYPFEIKPLRISLTSSFATAQSDERKLEIFNKVWEKCAVNAQAVSAKLVSAKVLRTTPVMKFGQPSGVSVVRIEIETSGNVVDRPQEKVEITVRDDLSAFKESLFLANSGFWVGSRRGPLRLGFEGNCRENYAGDWVKN